MYIHRYINIYIYIYIYISAGSAPRSPAAHTPIPSIFRRQFRFATSSKDDILPPPVHQSYRPQGHSHGALPPSVARTTHGWAVPHAPRARYSRS